MEPYSGSHRFQALCSVLSSVREDASPLFLSFSTDLVEQLETQLREALDAEEFEDVDVEPERIQSLLLEIQAGRRGWLEP